MRLSELHPTLSRDERLELAKSAETSEGYLWQLATQWKGKKPSLAMLSKLAKADGRLTFDDLMAEFADAPVAKPAAMTAQPRKSHQKAEA